MRGCWFSTCGSSSGDSSFEGVKWLGDPCFSLMSQWRYFPVYFYQQCNKTIVRQRNLIVSACAFAVSFQGLAAATALMDGWCNSPFLSLPGGCVCVFLLERVRERHREGDVAEWSLAWMFALQGGWLLGNGSVFVLFLERITAGEHNRFLFLSHTYVKALSYHTWTYR